MNVRLTPRARRQLDRLDEVVAGAIREALDRLAAEDENLDVKKMAGEPGAYRVRVGDYRVIFTREDGSVAIVARIGHRREVYRRH